MSTTAYTSNMFESIKSALVKQNENTPQKYKEILKTEPGNTYTVRLLPYIKNPSKSFFHYFAYTWNSFSNGQLISVVSPATWDQRDPIAEERYRIVRNGTEEEKKKAVALTRRENWMVNVYVVNDPVNPDNNGTVKVLRFGKQLHKIIMDAIQGEEAEEFGPKVFDLTPAGCSFKIKVERQGEYPTYVSSKFVSPKAIDELSDAASIKKVYESAHDLETFVTAKTYDEVKGLLDQHYHCNTDVEEAAAVPSTQVQTSTPAKQPVIEEKPVSQVIDDSIESLLKGLES